MEVDFIAKGLSAQLLQKGERTFFDQISFDSRTHILPSTLFFCFAGNYHNGHDFIPLLYQKGLRGFVISQPIEVKNYPKASFFLCKNIVKSLQNLAKEKRKLFKIPVIGITGSNGKTIVKEWLYELLSQELMILRSPKSYNSQIGVPFSVLLLEKKYELAIFEAGISKPGEMDYLEEIIQPEIGIFTNISEAHSVNFEKKEEKIKEKLNLFKNSKIIFYPQDQKEIVQQIQQLFPKKKKCSWGKNQEADLQILEVKKIEAQQNLIIFQYKNKKDQIIVSFSDPLSLENVFIVLTVVMYLGLLEKVKNRFSFLSSLAMRSEFLEGDQNSLIINDAYTADLRALSLSLDALFQLEQYPKKTLILSDFLDDKNPNLYQEIGLLLERYPVDQLIGVGENMIKNQNLFSKINQKLFYKETTEVLQNISKIELKDHAILLKGARKFHLEKVAHFLQRRKHQTWLEIRLDALEKNLTFFKSIVPQKTKMMAMVKARSYGSSEIEIAQFLQQKGVDYFGVAFESEGIALRENRIHLPILVMQAVPERLLVQLAHGLEPTLYSFAIFEAYIEKIKKEKLKKINFHIKIDTGMHRMGFLPEQIEDLLQLVKKNQEFIQIKTVYTHLAGAEDLSYDFFTQIQLEKFEKIKSKFIEIDPKIQFHALNSAGIQRFSAYAYDMVRLGIGLYGVGFSTTTHLEFAIKCKTKIIHLQKLPKGTPIGYNGKTVLDRDTNIATLPIGYADGLKRALGNKKWSVEVGGKLCPIVGNICMDFTMVDVGDLFVDLDQEVLIFGEKECEIEKMAAILDTSPYEILTSMSGRINRIFLKE